jgi:hypothetical protein
VFRLQIWRQDSARIPLGKFGAGRAKFELAQPAKVFTAYSRTVFAAFVICLRNSCAMISETREKFMKFKMTPMKICAAIILAIVAFGYSLASLDDSLTRYEKRNVLSSSLTVEEYSPNARFVSEISRPPSEPLARLFQLMFILFIISPPIIALMLFLIWKELKARNKMK